MTDSYGLALFVLQKVSCTLSGIGSLMIISQISRSPFNRSKPQQRLILGLSVSDLCTSVIWILTPLFMPADSGMLGAVGNLTTCNIQGFIVTMFNASAILYMCALQLQYLLTIKYSWSETRIHKEAEIYMHGIPWFLSLSAAITQLSLKLFNPADWDCWIAPYPADCTSSHDVNKGGTGLAETDCIRGDNAEIYRWSFFFAPLWAAIAFCIISMIMIYQTVREKEQRSQRHSIRSYVRTTQLSESSRNEKEKKKKSMLRQTQMVKAQCFMYTSAFFIVWSFPTIARFIQLLGGTIHPVIGVLAGTFIGSQGFFNALIYFRPRYNAMEKDGRLAKVWTLVCTTLLFCCYSKSRGTRGRYDSDYMKAPKSARSSLSNSRASAVMKSSGGEEDLAAAEDPDIEMDNAQPGPEKPVTTPNRPKRISFDMEPEEKSDEFIEEITGKAVDLEQ